MSNPAIAFEEEAGEEVIWTAHRGPQARFLRAEEFELFYGGALGGGKSDALLAKAATQLHKRGYRGVLIRTNFTELGELIDRSFDLYEPLGGKYNAVDHRWTFTFEDDLGVYETYIHFGFFEKWKDRRRYRGWQFSFIGWDEVGDCPEERFWLFMISRCRSTGPGINPQICGSGNPGGPGHGWLKRRFIMRCGKRGERVHEEVYTYTLPGQRKVTITLRRRFIPSRVTDNPTLMENNPAYVAQLYSLPDTMREQLLSGNWDAGEGLAFEEMDESRHIVPAFRVPEHWPVWGSFDWGYAHPWSFSFWTVNEDGRCYVIDTIRGRRMKDSDIIDRILASMPPGITKERLGTIAAGHDCWSEVKARSETGPTTAERFLKAGLIMKQANISRSDGYKELMHRLAWRGKPEDDVAPALVWMRTPGNLVAFELFGVLVTDPDHRGDVLKTDADPVTGEGGDDDYDNTRYGAMERPIRVSTAYSEAPVRAFDRAVLKAEMERGRRGLPMPSKKPEPEPLVAAGNGNGTNGHAPVPSPVVGRRRDATDISTYLGGF